MNKSKKTITLYFTDGPLLSEDDRAAMDRMPNARHRNAQFIDPEGKLEPCTYVAGPAIPDAYAAIPAPPVLVDANDVDEEEDDFDPSKANVGQLKAALDELGVKYEANAKKADLILLYEEHAGK